MQHQEETCCKQLFCPPRINMTVLRRDGQNHNHLHQVFSWFCVPKIIKIG